MKIKIEDNLSILTNSKESVLFVIKLIEVIIALELKNIEIVLNDKKLILKTEQTNYNEEIINTFIKHYNEDILVELFNGQITNIVIKG